MHLFLSNSILPFTQTLSFFVITLFVNRVSDELRLEKFFVFCFFLFCPNPNLPFLKYASFFVQFYSTVHSNPTFFCHNSILPFVPLSFFFCFHFILPFIEPSSFFVLNLILFYRLLKPHLFCHESILPFDQLPLYSVWILFYCLLKPHLFLS